ncbi:MAG: helix-turn-helix domain-containing protein [Chthoniobacterales bacterium]
MSKPADILRSTPIARDYAKSFAAATGLPLSIEAPGEAQLDSADLPECCRRMVAHGKACEKCESTHTALQGDTPRTVRCFVGLTSSAIPVVVRDKTVAYLHTGHAAVNGDADKRHTGAPRLTRGQYEGAVCLLELFSRQLAENLPAESNGSPYPAIDRAAREIRQNPEKVWRLTALARTAKMHPAYFSEMFHQRLGVTLTRFIAGARVDKARQLLRHTDLRIIEVAYAAGFGSVSQFNRVFSREAGCRPSAVRGPRGSRV